MILPANLPSLLRARGLTVVEIDGWRNRFASSGGGAFRPTGVLNHHWGWSTRGWSDAKVLEAVRDMATKGRPDLSAPLTQLAIDRKGTVYILAAGRANHAGKAKASGTVAAGDGNVLYVGIEWALSGTETIPAPMYHAGVVTNAVLTETVLNTTVATISCHYQTSITGKWDIGDPNGVDFKGKKVLDVAQFRRDVQAYRTPAAKPLTPMETERKHLKALKRKAKANGNLKRWQKIKDMLRVGPKH